MALSKIDAANFLTGTIPQGNVANASLGAVTALPAAISTGKVLQVVSANRTSAITTNQTSFTQTFGLSITPSSTSSKIFVTVQIAGFNDTTATSMYYTIYRNTTNLGNSSTGFCRTYNGGSNLGSSVVATYLDSPSTTSSTDYYVYVKADAGLAYISVNGATSTITAMEIEG